MRRQPDVGHRPIVGGPALYELDRIGLEVFRIEFGVAHEQRGRGLQQLRQR